ncbi:MAG: ankyrin repeat domain-containing protein [Legionellaceae bacterium]|nr:ankyrin repeat domain-containing protein [Legionellaceae bacterium]
MMNTQITTYNSFETTSLVDLWQLRTYLSAEISSSAVKAVSFDFLSEDSGYLKANIQALLSIELQGWDRHRAPTLDERKQFIMALFGHGFPVDIIYGVKNSLLKQAMDQHDLAMFEFLLSCCEIKSESKVNYEYLLEQLFDNQAEFIEAFFVFIHHQQIKINFNQKNADGHTHLMSSVLSHDIKLVERLITAGASLEEVSGEGKTALLIAAEEEDLNTVKLLVEHGANVQATDHHGCNLRSIACDQSSNLEPDLLNYLIERQVDVALDDYDDVPILIYAIQNVFDLSTIKLLITPERVNQPCPETGDTPLIAACKYNEDCDEEFNEFNDELIDLLLTAGANPAIKNKRKQTAMAIVKLRYKERDEDDEEADGYDDALEEQINKLAFSSYELYLAEDALLEEEADNFQAKLRLRSQAISVLKTVNNYFIKDYKKAQFLCDKLQLEIAHIYRDRFVFNLDDDLEAVVTQYEKLTRTRIESYKKAQFEIASLFMFVAERAEGREAGRAVLLRALKHADKAQDNDLSNLILRSLSGNVITDRSKPFSANPYERIDALTQEIQRLKQQLAMQSASSLIRKRSDSPVFSNAASSSSVNIENIESTEDFLPDKKPRL